MTRRKRRWLLASLAALLAWLPFLVFSPSALSPREQSLVGTWFSTDRLGTMVLDLHTDRRYVFRALDGRDIGPNLYSVSGRWRIANNTLICDWRSRWQAMVPVRIVSGDLRLGRLALPGLRKVSPEESRIISMTEETLTTNGRTWKRHPGSVND
jgi:hypothetical protein